MTKLAFLGLALWIGGTVVAAPALAQVNTITIATGSASGTYHPVGEAICKLVNAGTKDHGIRCTAQVATGSVVSLNQVRGGEIDLAMVQSDWQYHAVTGTSVFQKAGPNPGLRALMSLFPESLTIVAQRDAGIAGIADLKGKRVNLDQPGSGSRRTAEAVLTALGWQPSEFRKFNDLKLQEALAVFCNKRLDAIVVTVAHPNGTIKEALERCGGVLVPVAGGGIDGLVADNVQYVATEIPGDAYGMKGKTTSSLGVTATLVAMQTLDEKAAYQVVKAVGANVDTLKRRFPVFRNLSLKSMRRGNAAPPHPGAARFFKEAGAR